MTDAPPPQRRSALGRRAGPVVLALSGLGFPLTQALIHRGRRPGALAVQAVTMGLLVRDLVLVGRGAPARLQPVPALLLVAEATAALGATVTGLRLLRNDDALERAVSDPPDRAELARRIAVGTLFGLHTWRFRIYLSATRGLRAGA